MLTNAFSSLRDRAVHDFCAAMEFKAYTQLAFKFAEAHAKCASAPARMVLGYSKFAHSLGLPDKEIGTADISQHFLNAGGEPLLSLVHQHQVVVFEAAFFDLIRLLLLDKPKRLPSKRQVEYSVITSATTYQDIVAYLVDRELNELKYKPVSDWFEYLERLVSGLNITEDEVGKISEAKATRDLLVHNSGIVNSIYLQKAGKFSRFSLGDRVLVGGAYTLDVWQLLGGVVLRAIDRVIEKSSATDGDA
jgi:hypothetical protein